LLPKLGWQVRRFQDSSKLDMGGRSELASWLKYLCLSDSRTAHLAIKQMTARELFADKQGEEGLDQYQKTEGRDYLCT